MKIKEKSFSYKYHLGIWRDPVRVRMTISPGLNYDLLVKRFLDAGYGSAVVDFTINKWSVDFFLPESEHEDLSNDLTEHFTTNLRFMVETKHIQDVIDEHQSYKTGKRYLAPNGQVTHKPTHSRTVTHANVMRERNRHVTDYTTSAWDKLLKLVQEARTAV